MHEYDLILLLAIGFPVALGFGYITERLKLSPIVGYLLAGIVVGPFTPGFVADQEIITQLAEIGVILLMFGVGLHFHLSDLLAVRHVAIPGAIAQITISTIFGAILAVWFGWSLTSGIVLGVALSVASTVVLTRVLTDNSMLDTPHGHIAIGWLIVEDLFTILVLVLLPIYASTMKAGQGEGNALVVIGMAVLRLAVLTAIIMVAGKRFIPWLLSQVARTRSRELFTLTVLALAIAIATISATIFGASFALGAFLAGMVVGQTKVGHQAAADALPMRDAFAVLFFISVGMLFDPHFLVANPLLVASVLGIVLIAKPLAALAIVLLLGYSVRAALTVSLALAQVGEFTFILSSAALSLGVFTQEGQHALIAASLISIALNPLLFRRVNWLEQKTRKNQTLWRMLNRRSDAQARKINQEAIAVSAETSHENRAIVVGYGPVGQTVTRILRDFDIEPTIIELNIDTVHSLRSTAGLSALYGDAARPEILTAAGIEKARFLLLTVPDLVSRIPMIAAAKELNPNVMILVRARYLAEQNLLEELGAHVISFEEAEAAVGLSEHLLRAVGIEEHLITKESEKIRAELSSASLPPDLRRP